MKRIISLICIICISICFTAGCNNDTKKTIETTKAIKKPSVVITYGVVGTCTKRNFEDTISRLEKRVQVFSPEAWVEETGNRRIRVCVPGDNNEYEIMKELGKPGNLYFCTKEESTPSKKDLYQKKYIEIKEDKDDPESSQYKGYYKVWVTGDEVKSAKGKAVYDESIKDKQYVVSLKFNDAGAKAFGDMTSENIGNQTFIIYDNKVLTAPKVNEAILGGEAQIDGQKDLEEAENLASNIRIGALPVELREISHSVYK